MKIIAIMSPKGGVGKTTIAINIAWELKRRGAKVGLLDVDYHGPTLPVFLFGSWKLPKVEVRDDVVKPIEYDGVKVFSLAFIADEEVCMWSGETALQYTRALFNDVDWGDVEWLVVDTPPGLWDSNIEILARARDVVIVTEPTLVSVYDAKKLATIAKRKLIGVVVNEARKYAKMAKMLTKEEIKKILGYDWVYWVPFMEKLQEDPRMRLKPIKWLVSRILVGWEGGEPEA